MTEAISANKENTLFISLSMKYFENIKINVKEIEKMGWASAPNIIKICEINLLGFSLNPKNNPKRTSIDEIVPG